MAQPNSTLQLKSSFFHGLSKTLTEEAQAVYESLYKSGHNVGLKGVWGETVSYCVDETTADAFVTANPLVVKKYTQQALTEVPGSNGQAWYVEDTGVFMKYMIDPSDIPESSTSAPSYGFQQKLYTQAGVFIPPTSGAFYYDPFSGIVHFDKNYTPTTMGWGTPKLTAYYYIGKDLQGVLQTLGALSYKGTWDASTNTPPIPAAQAANNGWYYVVSTDGSTLIDGVNTWLKNDWILSNGTNWQRLIQNSSGTLDTFTITEGVDDYTLSGTPTIPTKSDVYLDGIRLQYGIEYTITLTQLSLIPSAIGYNPETGAKLIIKWS
jgi:hypothetical protein